MEEVVTKEPAALLQVGVACLGSASTSRDSGGGLANDFARKPEDKGEADSILRISKQALIVRSRQGAEPDKRAGGGTDFDADANEGADGVVGSNVDVSRLSKRL
jgi:hypothetical protein